MISSTTSKRAFTLIELLTVIVIIAILVALLFPAIKTVLLKAETNTAKADTKAIENAIRSYMNEYGRLPTQDQGGTDKWYDTASDLQRIYSILRGVAGATSWSGTDYNPRGIVFLLTPSRKDAFDLSGNFLDPWGNPYYLAFDCNYSGTLTGLTGAGTNYHNQAGPAVIVSFGPDRVSTNTTSRTDDITNYQ